MLQQFVYISKATKLLSSIELEELLEQARRRNAELSLTGILLYKDQSFMQLLEGPKDAVDIVLNSIREDSRHTRFMTILDEATELRSFKDWSMGFANLDEHTPSLDGFVDYFSEPSSIERLVETPSKALDLLHYFRTNS